MEGIPVSLMEALASGLPVVATKISGIPELVRNDQTGYLVPAADPQTLAEAFIAIVDDYDRALQLAKQGRELVMDEFVVERNVDLLSIELKSIVPGTR